MAVMQNSIIFGGVDSADFGIYIGGEGTFDAPKRDVEMISIPGRNGAFALDKGRFQNIEVTYSAFNREPDLATFSAQLEGFRNAICSQKGYQRLTDTFHPEEYRMAAYIDGLEIKPIEYNTAATFDIKFDCKPQRYLLSGEEPITIGEWHETETASGEIASFEAVEGDAVKSLVADIEPIQSLNGYDKPWSGGNGKNKLPSRNGTATAGGLTFSCNGDGIYHISGTSTSAYPQWLIENGTLSFPVGTTLTLSKTVSNAPSGAFVYGILYERDTPTGENLANRSTRNSNSVTFTIEHPYQAFVVVAEGNGITYTNTTIALQIELGSTATSWTPYSNICPISGHDEVNVYVSPTTSETDATIYTTDLNGTVYGGTLDVVSGVLTVTDGNIASYNGETLPSTWISDRDVYASGTTPTIGAQVVYKLATPTTVQLTAQEVELLVGLNQVWANSGDVSVEYGTAPNVLINPTLFESSPMLEAEGYGVIGINGSSIELEASELGRIVLGNQYAFRLGFSSLNTQVTEYINFSAESEQNLVAGDAIYLENILLSNWAILRNGSSVSSKTIEFKRSDSDTIEYSVFSEPIGTSNYYLYCRVPSISFEYGTQDTKTIYPRFNVTFVSGGGQSTWTSVFGFEFRYDGARTFRIGAVLVANASSGPYYDRGRTDVAIDYINGDSTKIVPYDPAYIDCDIGEAYIIQNDMVISINNATTMPAELPRLVAGDTEITFDNTITDLKVIPRWWKV